MIRVGRRHGGWNRHGFLRDIKIGQPAIDERFHIGEVARHGSWTFVHDTGGRRRDTGGAALRIRKGGHHQGGNFRRPGCKLLLPDHVRLGYLDTREIRWCSYSSVVFHSFAWPVGLVTDIKEAKATARTLSTNHCKWSDVLVLRGRCFGRKKKDFYVNRALSELFLEWEHRPFIVHSEGNDDVGDVPEGCESVLGDPVPARLDKDGHCVCNGLCRCNLFGNTGSHHPGRFCSNFLYRFEWGDHPSLKCQRSKVKMEYLRKRCNRHTMNDEIAAVLSRVAIATLARRHSHPVGGRLRLELVEPPKPRHGTLCGVDRHVVGKEVSEFLEQCGGRRKDEPLPKRIPWEKRLRWNGGIIKLTPVDRDERRARCAVVTVGSA